MRVESLGSLKAWPAFPESSVCRQRVWKPLALPDQEGLCPGLGVGKAAGAGPGLRRNPRPLTSHVILANPVTWLLGPPWGEGKGEDCRSSRLADSRGDPVMSKGRRQTQEGADPGTEAAEQCETS